MKQNNQHRPYDPEAPRQHQRTQPREDYPRDDRRERDAYREPRREYYAPQKSAAFGRREWIIIGVVACILLITLLVWIFKKPADDQDTELKPKTDMTDQQGHVTPSDNETEDPSQPATTQPKQQSSAQDTVDEAYRLAQMYDYDKALEMLKPLETEHPEVKQLIENINAEKGKAVRYANITETPHVFFHSLIVDTAKAFDGDDKEPGYNQVMTTVDEFNAIIQQMYERGFVLVSIHDMVKEVTGEDGKVTFQPGDIYLPPGKKPFVLSVDDVNYYEYMTGDGFPYCLTIDEEGKIKNKYKHEDGSVEIGDFDVAPILDRFIEKHPDFSYRGAKGILALTGYEGILGYRTDETYADKNPNFEADKAEAKRVAEGIKANGWEFASHSWGHIHMGTIDMEKYKIDADKWQKNVIPLIGECDTIIYPFGQDITQWNEYYDPAKYERVKILYDQGFRYFCNVDGSKAWMQYNLDTFRMGRRNLDGYRMYYDMIDDSIDMLSDLFDVNTVFDKARPTPVPPM